MKRRFERVENSGDVLTPLGEYPVREVLALYAHYHGAEPELVEPELSPFCQNQSRRGKIGRGLDIPRTLGFPLPWGGCRG